MPNAPAYPWLIKCALAAAAVLLVCRLAAALVGTSLQQPAATTRDGNFITLNRYVQQPTPDVVLVGSSVGWRLKEEYFLLPRLRNLALAGGSAVTGLAIVARQAHLPKIILIEANVLSRSPDDALVERLPADAPTNCFARCAPRLRPTRRGIIHRQTRRMCAHLWKSC